MAEQVAALWSEIIDWLRRNTPADAGRLRPPARVSLISEVEATIGRPLPDDVRQWWQQADGAVLVAAANLIPWGFAPMSCRNALDCHATTLDIWSEDQADDYLDDDDLDDNEFFGFHQYFLPIGDDHCGDCLYVDLRDGPEYGFVKFFDKEGANVDGFLWRSTTEMVTDIRDALIDQKPALLGRALRTATGYGTPEVFRATVTPEGGLAWNPERLGPSG